MTIDVKMSYPFRVFFGGHSSFRLASEGSVFIAPSHGDWNDFGHQTGCTFLVRSPSTGDVLEFRGFIGFLDDKEKDKKFVAALINDSGQGYVAVDQKTQYFTMMPDLEAYRDLIRKLGPEITKVLLLSLNDIVATEEFKPGALWLNKATETDVFTFSFVRSADSYFAYKNAGPVLRGLEFEELGKMSESLRLKFKLPGYENDHDLTLNFDHAGVLPKRIAVIIGENGVGKSQCLKHAAQAILGRTKGLSDSLTNGRPMVSRLLAFAPTNEAAAFPTERRSSQKILYRRFSMNRSRRAKRKEYISDLIVQLARSYQSIAGRSRWKLFVEAISALRRSDQIVLATNNDEEPFVYISALKSGGEQTTLKRYSEINLTKEPLREIDGELYPLSSGEISFLKFAAQVGLHIENGTLLLIDEPETHLHPQFIGQFVALLDRLLELTGSAAIIATHSVYFVREVFREQVNVLSVTSEGWVNNERPRLNTFGGDVGAISFFVFGEDAPSILAERVVSHLTANQLSWDQVYSEFKDEMSTELLMGVRRKMMGEVN